MAATANPHFDLQHQALSSLRQVQRVCLGLEVFQVVLSVVVLVLGYLSTSPDLARVFHMYTAMTYCFAAVFAHVVVYYVLMAMGRNVRSAYATNPQNVNIWLVSATSKLKLKSLPFYALHAATLLFNVLTASVFSIAPSPLHKVAAVSAVVTGIMALVASFISLKRNAEYLKMFVTTGGFSDAREHNI